MIISDCCGVEIVNDIAGLELCPSCWEHCDCIVDDSMEKAMEDNSMTMEEYDSLPDYIPGFDDGEAV